MCQHAWMLQPTHRDPTFAWQDGSPIIDLDSPDDDTFDSDYAPLDSKSTGGDVDDDLSFVSNGDLTTTGVDEMNNNDDNNNNNNNNNDDDNNNDNENNNDEHNVNANEHKHEDPEEQETQEEANPEEQAAKEQEEAENENGCKAHEAELNSDNKEKLNDNGEDPGVTTGVDTKIAGVAQITGVEPEIDADSEDEENQVEAEMDCRYGPQMHSHDLQPRKPCDYSHLHGDLEHTALTQYNVRKD